jgi:hypothetical protein
VLNQYLTGDTTLVSIEPARSIIESPSNELYRYEVYLDGVVLEEVEYLSRLVA